VEGLEGSIGAFLWGGAGVWGLGRVGDLWEVRMGGEDCSSNGMGECRWIGVSSRGMPD